jgi:hypothetical protein
LRMFLELMGGWAVLSSLTVVAVKRRWIRFVPRS